MVKDQNHRIKKHLPTVVDAAKDGAAKAIDIVREHKKGMLIIGGFIVAGGTIAGTVAHFAQKDKQKAKKQLGDSFQRYIDAAQTGMLTVEILDNLIDDLDAVAKLNKDDIVPLNLSTKQLISLFNSIHDYTVRMAEANCVDLSGVHKPNPFKKNGIVVLQNYLYLQKEILSGAA